MIGNPRDFTILKQYKILIFTLEELLHQIEKLKYPCYLYNNQKVWINKNNLSIINENPTISVIDDYSSDENIEKHYEDLFERMKNNYCDKFEDLSEISKWKWLLFLLYF